MPFRSARIKDHYGEQQLFMRRAFVAGGLILFGMLALIGRLIWLQVVQYDYYFDLSQGNRIRNEPLPPNRGLLLDRNGIGLGLNAPSYQLELTREQVPNLEATLQVLAGLALLDRADVPRLKRDIMSRRAFETVPLKLQLSDEELARFAVRRHELPGVDIQPRMTRYYPLAGSAVHATGYVSAISTEDQKNIDIDEYEGTTLIGKTGIERAFEKELHGKKGYQQLLVNAQGRRVDRAGVNTAELKRTESRAGNDLYLTIDQRVQQAAEEMLRGRRAAAVALDPNNGDVIALVSTPGFNPNLFSRGISRADYRALTDNPDIPLYDRALRGAHAPGSTIKPFMALAALQYGVVTAEEPRYCRGSFRLPNVSRPWRDFKPEGHGYINAAHAIEESCDVYFYGTAELMGIDRIHDFLSPFGFGRQLGIDIGGERAGSLPSTEWKRNNFRQPDQKRWYPGDTIHVGIGQGYMSATPLQLAYATSVIATRGQRFQPRLVRAVRDSSTGAMREIPPRPLSTVTVKDPSYWDTVIEGMTAVTKGARGTARASGATAQYVFAGKTGTAQVVSVSSTVNIKEATKTASERQREHAWFIAFAPVEKPTIAVAVIVENGGTGGSAAAPVARRMFDAYLLSPEALKEQDLKGKSPGIKVVEQTGDAE
jgi:penicillin-binding protein 2